MVAGFKSQPCQQTTEIFYSPKVFPSPVNKKTLWAPADQLFRDFEITCTWPDEPIHEDEVNKDNNKRTRKVRFAPPFFNNYAGASCDNVSDCLDLWWKADEFDAIMSKNLHTATEARRHVIVAGGLDHALQIAVRMASLVEEPLEEHLHKMQEEHRGLTLWCQYGHSRRGLEKFTSRQYCDIRRKQMRQLSQRVVALSKLGADPTELRQASEEASRISIIFAGMLAIADYKAATSSFPGEDERVKALEKTTLHPSTVWQRKRAEKLDQVCV